MSLAERLAITPELRDTSQWECPKVDDLPEEDREKFKTRKKAIEGYLEGKPFATIKKDTGFEKKEVYRMLERCLTPKPDGAMYGFYGLVPSIVVKPYQRTLAVDDGLARQGKGLAGAFMQMMSDHPQLHEYVEKQARKAATKSAKVITKTVHAEFIKKCSKVRAPNEYPFNTEDRATRALTRYIQRLLEKIYGRREDDDATEMVEDPGPLTGQPTGTPMLRPFEETEHDGHNGDFYFVVKMRGLQSEWIYTTPMRIWLLLLIDRASRALLGYSYRFGSTNYPAVAVVRSFAHSLIPWTPKEITLPNLAYKEGAGFPSGVITTACGRLVDMVCFDKAMANTAGLTVKGLTRQLGAIANFGRAGTPTARPFVERLNQSLETLGFRRLPNGFDPKGPKADREKALKAAEEHAVTIDEIEQILDVMLANSNAEHHSALANRTPLEFIRMWDSRSTAPLRRVEDPRGLAVKLLRLEFIKNISGGGERQRPPYVELWAGRYTNDVLRKITDWKGLKARVVIDVDGDIRFMRAYIRRGKNEIDIGVLRSGAPWHLTPHTLQERQMIRRANKVKKIVVPPGSDLAGTFFHIKQREAESRKGAAAANQLARMGGPRRPPEKPSAPVRDALSRVRKNQWVKLK